MLDPEKRIEFIYLRGEFLIRVLFDMEYGMNQNGILRIDLVDDQKRKLI